MCGCDGIAIPLRADHFVGIKDRVGSAAAAVVGTVQVGVTTRVSVSTVCVHHGKVT